ncbi:hypothetical protein HMSSN036_92510 [Paenibacillus macerans]|nr:hypothetical protein HMSSN036_92510 [Paenibacillus macerans]
MRQSTKSKAWRSVPLLAAGDRGEARMLARTAEPEAYELIPREVKPSAEWLPRPGS